MKRDYRVFIGLQEIAGYGNNLEKGFREIGVDSQFIDLSLDRFNYGLGKKSNLYITVIKNLKNKLFQFKNNLLIKTLIILLLELMNVPIFIWTLIHFNVFVFLSNSRFFRFFNYFELSILKFFKKKIIYVYLGSDSRPIYLNGAFILNSDGQITIPKTEVVKKQKKKIKTIEKYADFIINHPPQAYFHERKYISLLSIGLPFNFKEKETDKNKEINKISENTDKKMVVLHAPSKSVSKGTQIIRTIINNIMHKGYSINYIELINKTNLEVLEELRQCDIVIDEVYGDTSLGVLGIEAAYFGKPTIVSGYYSEFIINDLGANNVPPSLYCLPEQLEENLELLINNHKLRLELAERSQKFVKERFNPKRVAENYLKLLEGDYPKDWVLDPYQIEYPYGYGLSIANLKKVLNGFINQGNIKDLHLNDKPKLIDSLLKSINEEIGEN